MKNKIEQIFFHDADEPETVSNAEIAMIVVMLLAALPMAIDTFNRLQVVSRW